MSLKRAGRRALWFPAILTRKFYEDQGKPLINYEEVVELSTAELDQALFEVPPDFTQRNYANSRDDRPSVFGRVFSFMRRR